MRPVRIMRLCTVVTSLDILLKGQMRFLREKGYAVTAVTSGQDCDLRNISNREGVSVLRLTMSRRISIFQDLKALYKLYCLIKSQKPDIVHSITPKAGLLAMIASKAAGVPIRIHTFTGLVFPTTKGLKRCILICTDKITCFFANKIIPEGVGIKKDLEYFRITNKPLCVVANGNVNGIDSSYFDPSLFVEQERMSRRKSLGISPKDFVFIFVGRLVGDKGINELVEAFCDFGCMNHVKLLLVGSYEEYLDPLRLETISLLRANPNIIEVGWQEDVRPFFAISDALVFPSYREGFPNVVMQAGAMGLPSIVTDINGCNEIIKHGVNGLIIPSRDRQALLRAMKTILDDSQLRQCMARQSRPMITSRYEQIMVWEALLEEYRSLEKQYL